MADRALLMTETDRIRKKPYFLALFMGALLLGVAPVAVKALPFAAEVSAFYRVLLAVPFIALIGWNHRQVPLRVKPDRRLILLIVAATLFFAADLAVMHLAIRSTHVAVATLLTNCAPFFVALFGFMGLTRRPGRGELVFLPIALVGIFLLCGTGMDLGAGTRLEGIGLSLLAALFYAAYIVTIKHVRAYDIPSSYIMLAVTSGSAVLLSPLFFMAGSPVPTDATQWALLLCLVLCGQVFGQLLVTIGLKHLSAAFGSLVLLIQPIVAALISWLLLSEQLGMAQLLGMSLVLIAIMASSLASK